MQVLEKERLLQIYEEEIEAAYAELLDAFMDLLTLGVGDPRSMAGRCGARVAAAHKRCKRGLVFSELVIARDAGLDITPTVAEHVCERLIGRGVDFRKALTFFGTPGRTAAQKSGVVREDMASIEAQLAPQVSLLIYEMSVIRERHKEEYGDRVEAAVKDLQGQLGA
ncbi:hypothetical protein ACQKPT_23750 [Pseudomonas monteilii]|uniref:hypothetical protein n=1 Tax=Pseudomonas monteilii TaxID=76759 RepID=UPI003D080CD8